ncbi:MAG: hypothetical protein B6241_14470 [Spirochaetaceae bacterium 4572_59]|nr:MAG: hypothetical protein B6241_14470 [Spirochaetaceae bacterium 4572_59]
MQKQPFRHSRVFLILFIAVISASCTTMSSAGRPNQINKAPRNPVLLESSSLQKKLADSAYWAEGRKTLVVQNRKFNMDCSGVVLAIYYHSGIDLTKNLGSYSGGGVQRLYDYLNDLQLLYKSNYPAQGDLLFWDNTYDKNNDGASNDELTHVGMVVESNSKGDVIYIHHNYRRGIVMASMNLLDPDNLDRNSPMRARGAEEGHAAKWLSSHLLRNAGKAYEIPLE